MRPLPTAPSADDEISASFMRRLIECIKERTIISAPGYRTKSGPNGTTLEIEPGKRDRRAAAARVPYWSFTCTEDPDTHERTGGWMNCVVQIGFSFRRGWFGNEDWPGEIDGLDLTDDGHYAVKVKTGDRTAEIVKDPERLEPDFENGFIYFELGWIVDGKLYQTAAPGEGTKPRAIDVIPVAYIFA